MEKYTQPPILTGHAGGQCLSASQIEREWRDAWAQIADACEAALSQLHPMHPRRQDLLVLMRDARRAAQLPDAPHLRTA
jgi:hypothetical protein